MRSGQEGALMRRGRGEAGRHRWAGILTRRIFLSSCPYLANTETLRELGVDEHREAESALRLSLLWDELRCKTEGSPTAVLGLVDIARSRRVEGRTWRRIDRVVVRAIERAVGSVELDGVWNFLYNLLGKLGTERLEGVIGGALRTAGIELARRDLTGALRCLRGDEGIHSRYSDELVGGVASQVANSQSEETTRALATIAPNRLVRIALREEKMLERLFVTTQADLDADLRRSVAKGIQGMTAEERRCHFSRLVGLIRGDVDGEILAKILYGARGSQLIEAVNLIWSSGGLRTCFVGDILCAAAIAGGNRRDVRANFARIGDDKVTDRCIQTLLRPDREDVRWVLDNREVRRRSKYTVGRVDREIDRY